MNRLTTLAIALALFATGCAFETGSGHLIAEDRHLPTFTEVEVHDGFQADISVGYDQQVQVIADDNLMHHVDVHVEGRRLMVEVDEVTVIDGTLRVRISVPALTAVVAHGGGNVVAAGIASPGFNVEAHGGSEIELIGSCGDLWMDLSGGSKAHAYSLPCNSARAELSGGSEAEVTVADYLDVEASGGSQVDVSGDPRISHDLSGGSEINYR